VPAILLLAVPLSHCIHVTRLRGDKKGKRKKKRKREKRRKKQIRGGEMPLHAGNRRLASNKSNILTLPRLGGRTEMTKSGGGVAERGWVKNAHNQEKAEESKREEVIQGLKQDCRISLLLPQIRCLTTTRKKKRNPKPGERRRWGGGRLGE